MDPFLQAAIAEAEAGLAEGGIPIGSVLVHQGRIIGRGHNRRVQQGSVVLHGEMDALENAGRQSADVYRQCTVYTTLSPWPCARARSCSMAYPELSSAKIRHSWVKKNCCAAAAYQSRFFKICVVSKSCNSSFAISQRFGTKTLESDT